MLPWLEEEIRSWRSARAASDILDPDHVSPAPDITDPVVLAAMKSPTIRVNLATGITNSYDRDAAVTAFQLLHRAGHYFDPEEVKTWASANGWRATDALKLADVAKGVLKGHRYQVHSGGGQQA